MKNKLDIQTESIAYAQSIARGITNNKANSFHTHCKDREYFVVQSFRANEMKARKKTG